MLKASDIRKQLQDAAIPERARVSKSFFKTGPGEYGEGDKFIGVTVPAQRRIAKAAEDLSDSELNKLIKSPWHEERLTALLILVNRYERAKSAAKKAKAVAYYIKNLKYVNNWDLVDTSAYRIIGAHLVDSKNRKLLYKWAKSKNMWERRVAIIATLTFIRAKQFEDTLKLAKLYLTDEEDLMHKATGWMLRELGKRDTKVLVGFLEKHAAKMPRTMLRYAIEKFPETKRKYYLSK